MRQGQTRGFNDDVVRGRVLLQQLLYAWQEIISHGAADTAIGKFDDVIGATVVRAAFLQHVGIHADVAKFIHDQRQALAVGLRDDIADQRCLAGA